MENNFLRGQKEVKKHKLRSQIAITNCDHKFEPQKRKLGFWRGHPSWFEFRIVVRCVGFASTVQSPQSLLAKIKKTTRSFWPLCSLVID